jgi:hypothetical protein
MSEYLTNNSRLEEKQILKMVCEFANEGWVNESAFVKKEHYFNFAEVIAKQIKELCFFETKA